MKKRKRPPRKPATRKERSSRYGVLMRALAYRYREKMGVTRAHKLKYDQAIRYITGMDEKEALVALGMAGGTFPKAGWIEDKPISVSVRTPAPVESKPVGAYDAGLDSQTHGDGSPAPGTVPYEPPPDAKPVETVYPATDRFFGYKT
jgi:hypothetical protein